MSLLLRKGCQEPLDKLGLTMLHAAISNKILCIKGECGQDIVRLFGIEFASNQAKVSEIDFAIELFDKFLATNGKALVDLVTAKQAFAKLIKPDLPNGFTIGYADKIKYKIKDESYKIEITRNGLFSIDIDNIESKSSAKKVYDELLEQVKPADTYFKKLAKYNTERSKVDELSDAIAKCDI